MATSSTNSTPPLNISGSMGLMIIVILVGLAGIILMITILRSARKQMNPPRWSAGEKQPHVDAWTESGRRSAQADRKPPPPRPSIRHDNSNDDTDLDFEAPS